MTSLFDPIRMGRLTLPNRIIMAPLTRGRTCAAGVPDALVAEYYAQRASAGLLIAEARIVSRVAQVKTATKTTMPPKKCWEQAEVRAGSAERPLFLREQTFAPKTPIAVRFTPATSTSRC